MMHGGDIYSKKIKMDFSVNINPLPLPFFAKKAFCRSVRKLKNYPDMNCRRLKEKMSEITHHGLDRKSHSIRVSYYSYKISKALGLDYKSTARAGLIHDFFFENNQDK